MHLTTRFGSTPIAAAILAAFANLPAAAQSGDATPQTVEVIGTAPLAGLGVPRELLPYSSLVVRRSQLEQAQADTLTDHLWRRAAGVQVNDIQGSPFQADLSYRGFRASGLIGSAQGIAVFLDGVRINEPFGDVVNWDLVPEFALRDVTLVSGANPAFGLNALGGAIALSTVDGRSATGVRGEISAGSFGRRRVEAGIGQRHGDGWHSYIGGQTFDERGWRDYSPGRTKQLLAKVGREAGGFAWHATLLAGRSTLVGNGLVPAFEIDNGELEESLYDEDNARVVYTHPDRTRNELLHLALGAEAELGAGRKLQALIYGRSSRRNTVNGDVAEEFDPGEPEINAALNQSTTRQRAAGAAVSVAGLSGAHRWQAGLQLDHSSTRFAQQEQEASFDGTRLAVPGAEEAETSVRVSGKARHVAAYGTDTWSLTSSTHLTGTLRANHSVVANTLETLDEVTEILEARPRERFTYRSLNPSLGIVQQLGAGLGVFGSVARNARVPTVIELGCADPDEPCRLPAGLQSDPYLKQVRSTSIELGLRGSPLPDHRFELVLFRTDNRDDIVFGSVSLAGQLGYFRNFPRTRHQGADLSVSGRLGPLGWSAAVSRLDATYEASDTLRQGERNVEVQPGTRIAGLPRSQAKVGLDWAAGAGWSLGVDVQRIGSRVVQGNEDGRLEDGGDAGTWLRTSGYTLLDLRASWRLQPQLVLFARVRNALDKRYESYGALAETQFERDGTFNAAGEDALFVAPGAPRTVMLGLRLSW